MRVGDHVLYVPAPGSVVAATIVAVVGSGASGYKVLDLSLATERKVTNVPHARDVEKPAGYWCRRRDEVLPTAKARRTSSEEKSRAARDAAEKQE